MPELSSTHLHPSRVLAALPAALLLGVSACGGSAASDAASVQQNLVVVADALDRCVGQQGDARKCTDEDALGDLSGATLGGGSGEVEINASKPTRYQLTAKADGDVSYAILAQPVGARKRVCSPVGTGGCPQRGVW